MENFNIKYCIILLGFIAIATGFRQSNEMCSKNYVRCDFHFSDTLQKDTIIRIDAKPNAGFNYAYYVFIPSGTLLNSRHFLLVEANNTGVNDTIEFHDQQAKLQALKNSSGSSVSKRLKMPFLVPVFPRSEKDWQVYTHALDRDAMLIKSGETKRIDLQLIAMIEDANTTLSSLHISLEKKICINGFSASGTFANRFTLIHPEIVAAVACGGINAISILPVSSIDDSRLNYPIGTNDFKAIFGTNPNLEAYKKIPQFIYMGGLDSNDAVLFDDAYSEEERQIIFKVLGKKMFPDRWGKCESIYSSNGINATYKLYPDIGHATNRTMNSEIADFFKKNIKQ